jgi:hypothetical protein
MHVEGQRYRSAKKQRAEQLYIKDDTVHTSLDYGRIADRDTGIVKLPCRQRDWTMVAIHVMALSPRWGGERR